MEYPITPNDDPNMIDKILSRVSSSRKIVFTYGDSTVPGFMYRNEEAIITQVNSTPDVASSKITYTISATSTAIGLNANTFSFPRVFDKPSNQIRALLKDRSKGLLDIFYGMHDSLVVDSLNLIESEDKEVEIPAQTNMSVLDYLKYLVSCMIASSDNSQGIFKSNRYVITFYDGVSEQLDGPYFKVSHMVSSSPAQSSLYNYELDIGYPSKDLIQNFSITDNQAYSILYDYSQEITTTDSVYRISDEGDITEIASPSLAKSGKYLKTTEADRTWWSNVTQYPIKASLTIRGLLKAIILMSYIKINVLYYGRKHNTSGLYIVNQQDDSIDASGYRTTLSLIRIQGDSEI